MEKNNYDYKPISDAKVNFIGARKLTKLQIEKKNGKYLRLFIWTGKLGKLNNEQVPIYSCRTSKVMHHEKNFN